uniref:Sensory neuron membrane protein 2 n=1 Tax=Oedaleus asiaticus TaxID=244712 RepID=A0A410HWL9_9ORTH|nr:sensory neurone membrane protein SNMP2a [Oedaleus asiaticus]
MLSARVCGCGRRGLWWGLAAGAVVLAAALVLRWAAFPAILTAKITQAVQIQDGSAAMERFVQLPQPLLYKAYLFNVTNPDQVSLGAKPALQEVGPYVYEEWRRRRDVTRLEDGSLSYRLETTFRFSPERSPGLSEDDEFTYLNVVMMGIVVQVAEDYASMLTMVEPVLSELLSGGAQLFLRATARQLLWDGVPTVDCRGNLSAVAVLACSALPSLLPPTVQQAQPGVYAFSFFGFKNGTARQWWRVDPGLSDVRSLGAVLSYDNSSRLKVWTPASSPCNDIRGTDSTIFPPFRDPKEPIVAFGADLCLSLGATWERSAEYMGVPGNRYTGEMPDMTGNPEHHCYCPSETSCLEKGALDLSPCAGAPVIATLPHFYLSSESYLRTVSGLQPTKEHHELFMVFESTTGSPMEARKRLQFNMFLHKINKIDLLANVPYALMPLIWVEEGLALEEKYVSTLRMLFKMQGIMSGVKWTMMVVGMGMAGAGGYLHFKRRKELVVGPAEPKKVAAGHAEPPGHPIRLESSHSRY